MVTIDAKELWRQVSPEEKFELISRAQARGVFSALVGIIVGCTVAVCLHQPWFLWGSVILSPMVFQLSSWSSWRTIKPKVMLEYLGARSAARRYAFAHRTQDLGLVTILKANLEQQFTEDTVTEALEALEEAVEKNLESTVWLALFNHAVVAIAERPGGAELKMCHLVNKKLQVTSNSPGGKEYSSDHEVILSWEEQQVEKKYKLTSRYPAALIVFEKKLKNLISLSQEVPMIGHEEPDADTDRMFKEAAMME